MGKEREDSPKKAPNQQQPILKKLRKRNRVTFQSTPLMIWTWSRQRVMECSNHLGSAIFWIWLSSKCTPARQIQTLTTLRGVPTSMTRKKIKEGTLALTSLRCAIMWSRERNVSMQRCARRLTIEWKSSTTQTSTRLSFALLTLMGLEIVSTETTALSPTHRQRYQ